ncbi:MAG TPA: hypothetical protein VMW95_09330, partial [Desulfobacterales bacterium]|nr:hypothetical protein [Desulfobacterales bacterium]
TIDPFLGMQRGICSRYWKRISTSSFSFLSGCYTLNERKSRMPQIRGIKGEVVVIYCEPLITKRMGCHRLS